MRPRVFDEPVAEWEYFVGGGLSQHHHHVKVRKGIGYHKCFIDRLLQEPCVFIKLHHQNLKFTNSLYIRGFAPRPNLSNSSLNPTPLITIPAERVVQMADLTINSTVRLSSGGSLVRVYMRVCAHRRFQIGYEIPLVGFGVYQIDKDETKAAVLEALRAGYR